MEPNEVQKQQKQFANAGRDVTQAGRDCTQNHSVRVGIWISVTLIAIVAIGAAVFFKMFGGESSGTEILIKPSVEEPAKQSHE